LVSLVFSSLCLIYFSVGSVIPNEELKNGQLHLDNRRVLGGAGEHNFLDANRGEQGDSGIAAAYLIAEQVKEQILCSSDQMAVEMAAL
jgi:hypothetical protein